MARPAPSSPDRLPVRRLDGDAPPDEARRAPRCVPRIASRRAPPRRGRAPRMVTSTLCGCEPRAFEPARATTSTSSARLSMPAVAGSPAGNSRPRSPSPAAPAARRRARGGRRRRRSGRAVAVRPSMPGRPVAGRRQARRDGCRGPMRCAQPARSPASRPAPSSRSVRLRHLDVGRLAGDRHDRDAVAGEQLGLVGEHRRAAGVTLDGGRAAGRGGRLGASARGRARRARPASIDPVAASSTPLEGIDHWQHRDDRAALCGGLDDTTDEPAPRRAAARRRGRGPRPPSWPARRRRPSPGAARHRRPRHRRLAIHGMSASSARRSPDATTTMSATGAEPRPPRPPTAARAAADDRVELVRARPSGCWCPRPRRPRRRRAPASPSVPASQVAHDATAPSVPRRRTPCQAVAGGASSAKTIRPATVWRMRVTVTSSSPWMCCAAALHDDHRAVVEERHALPGLLALLDDLDPERLARQERRLQRVRELVDVQDPDALELRDPVEVVVGRQDAARRGAARGRRAWRPRSASRARPRRSARGRRDGPSGAPRARRARAAPGCAGGAAQSSAMCCSSPSTKRGTTSVPLRKPDATMSTMRPSMIALVST